MEIDQIMSVIFLIAVLALILPGFLSTNSDLKKLMSNKLLTIRAADHVVRVLPPLNVKKKEIDQALKIINKVCAEFK